MRGLAAEGATHPLQPPLDAVSLLAALDRAPSGAHRHVFSRLLRSHLHLPPGILAHLSGDALFLAACLCAVRDCVR